MGQVPSCLGEGETEAYSESDPNDAAFGIASEGHLDLGVARRAAGVADLFGVLEITGATAVGAMTRLAVAEALAAVARRGRSKRLLDERPGAPADERINVEVARHPSRPDSRDALRFAYSLRLTDPGGIAGAKGALEREAAVKGTSRLLPCFVQALKAHSDSHDDTALAKLSVTEWTLEAASDVREQDFREYFKNPEDRASQGAALDCSGSAKDTPLLFAACSANRAFCAGPQAPHVEVTDSFSRQASLVTPQAGDAPPASRMPGGLLLPKAPVRLAVPSASGRRSSRGGFEARSVPTPSASGHPFDTRAA